MTAKQILDAFSETLMQDERILSPRERELLLGILQNSRTVPGANQQIDSIVSGVIGRAVGETVAQRAFSLLGGSIVEKILVGSGIPLRTEDPSYRGTDARSPQPPNAPAGSPQPPNLSPQPPNKSPQPPNSPAGSPQPPNAAKRSIGITQPAVQELSQTSVGVLDRPEMEHAPCVVLDEFLAPKELDELMRFALEHEPDFRDSEVVSPSGEEGLLDYSHRRSRVLMDLGKHGQIILGKIRGVLPQVLRELGMDEFPVSRTEAQITASNNGDFFRTHSDDADALVASRRLTFVYFFQREPRAFQGGDLLLHNSHPADRRIESGNLLRISPRQNQIVFFPSPVPHEITPVDCPSRAFADSRFTLNGWLHR